MDLFITQNEIPPPPYDDTISHSDDIPFQYRLSAVCESVTELDLRIAGQTSDRCLDSCERSSLLSSKAELHRSQVTAFSAIKTALNQIATPVGRYSLHKNSLHTLTSILVSTAVHDIVQPLHHLTRMAITLTERRIVNHRAENEIVAEILDSYPMALQQVFVMLKGLRLETPESLKMQVQAKGFDDFLALVRLVEAFGSRYAPLNTIYLFSGRVLRKEYCSGIVRMHFDQIHDLKKEIIHSDLLSVDASEALITKALRTLQGDSFELQSPIPAGLLRVLRKVRKELPGLILSDRSDGRASGQRS